MKYFLLLLFFCLPLGLFPESLVAKDAPSPAASKIKVVYHNINVCPVSGVRVDGDHRKFEVVYMEGNTEHHIYLSNQTYSKQFYHKPDFYLQKVEAIEASGGNISNIPLVAPAP